jgi:hypothetical protein
MIYLAKKNGILIIHTDIKAMGDLDGVNPEKTVSDADWAAAGGSAYIKNGEITLGPDPQKVAERELQDHQARIDKELEGIDLKSIRPIRSALSAIANGETQKADDLEKLAELNAKSEELRVSRETITEKKSK